MQWFDVKPDPHREETRAGIGKSNKMNDEIASKKLPMACFLIKMLAVARSLVYCKNLSHYLVHKNFCTPGFKLRHTQK